MMAATCHLSPVTCHLPQGTCLRRSANEARVGRQRGWRRVRAIVSLCAVMDLWWKCAWSAGKRSGFLAQGLSGRTVFWQNGFLAEQFSGAAAFCRAANLYVLNRGSFPHHE